ncbi:hypothetical protein [Pandoravirus japonicus]|uniref:Uncharacterized protein n=1 Tax=Pandoravirus japonicus TaxID=2823154 RepID=A0A811BSD5_9VIRU|nr:hypothetical protein [Pandoravirus japonicus]
MAPRPFFWRHQQDLAVRSCSAAGSLFFFFGKDKKKKCVGKKSFVFAGAVDERAPRALSCVKRIRCRRGWPLDRLVAFPDPTVFFSYC